MARATPLWQQSGDYSAQADRQLIAGAWPAGGVRGGISSVVQNTMNISVAPGLAAVPLPTGQGCALCRWDAAEVVAVPAAPPSGQTRADIVVVTLRDSAFDGGANNDFILQVIAGTPVTDPAPTVPPAVPPNSMALAWVGVSGGIANLNGMTVLDRRRPLLPGTSARYWRNQAWTVPATPGMVGAYMDRREYDDFSGNPPGDSTTETSFDVYRMTGTEVVRIPSAGLWRIRWHSTANTNNQWYSLQFYYDSAQGARAVFASQATPMNTWLAMDCELVTRFAGPREVRPQQQGSAGLNGVTGPPNAFLEIEYRGP